MNTLIAIGQVLAMIAVLCCAFAVAFLLVLAMPVVFCFVLPFIVAVVIWRLIR